MKVVIINGSGGCGKDTFITYCQEYLDLVSPNKFILNYSSITFVKNIAKQCGWDGRKTERDRKFLSDLKDLLIDYNDLPFKVSKEFLSISSQAEGVLAVFLHMREPSEIEKVKSSFKTTTLLLTRPELGSILSNHADKEVGNFNYDYYVENEGTLIDLRVKAINFIKEVMQDASSEANYEVT